MSQQHHTLVIVGGGAAGISVANNMHRQNPNIDIAIIEPSETHYYQPAFTIIGGGAYTLKRATRNEADLINLCFTWIKDAARTFNPVKNTVTLRSGDKVTYDYLVVCPGLQLDWNKIEGLKKTLGKNNVCSNYSAGYCGIYLGVHPEHRGRNRAVHPTADAYQVRRRTTENHVSGCGSIP